MEKLSRDLIIDITSRLPIKSVLRCKSVCKSWEALLSDPSFAAAHFNRASALTPFSNYIVGKGEKHAYFIEIEEDDDETTMSKPKHLTFPFLTDCLTRFTSPRLMGSCLGFVCLSATDDLWPGAPTNPIYLFNPITGANILLPQFEADWSYSCVCGFGLDVSKQECKVVLVFLHEKTFSVLVHTVGRDSSWRTNTVPNMLTHATGAELTNDRHHTHSPVEFNGSIHWIISSSVDDDDMFGPESACILSFQLDTEVFRVIPMPEPLQVTKPYFCHSMDYALQVCGGCLSIIYSPEASFVDMWVMADYSQSWVKTYSIQLNCMRGSGLMTFGFRKNGELMLYSEEDGLDEEGLDEEGLVSYNTNKDRYKILWSYSSWTRPFPFMGSLISLKPAYGDSEEKLFLASTLSALEFEHSVLSLASLIQGQDQQKGDYHIQEPSSD